jgi:hypothetical protein
VAIKTVLFSKHLRETMHKVEKLTGRKIKIETLESNPDLANSDAQGFHAREGGTEHIWLDTHLSPAAYEATIAHELAHIVQRALGFPRARGIDKQYEMLAQRINNLVLDVHADRWAQAEGFNMKAALAESALPKLTSALQDQPVQTELLSSKTDTQALAVDYAALKLRLDKFGLFAELDRGMANRWPESWRTGRELWLELRRYRFSSAPSCRQAIKKVLAFLGIPGDLIQISVVKSPHARPD